MIEKEITISKRVYEASDGRQFDFPYEAEDWDKQIYFRDNIYPGYVSYGPNQGCILINSVEDAKIASYVLSRYYGTKGLSAHVIEDRTTFPVLLDFDEERGFHSTRVVDKEVFPHFRYMLSVYQKICSLYDKTVVPFPGKKD